MSIESLDSYLNNMEETTQKVVICRVLEVNGSAGPLRLSTIKPKMRPLPLVSLLLFGGKTMGVFSQIDMADLLWKPADSLNRFVLAVTI